MICEFVEFFFSCREGTERKKKIARKHIHVIFWCMRYLWFGSIGNVRFLLRRLPFELSLWQALLKFKWTGRPQRQTLLKLLHAVLDDDMVVRINVASVLKLGCPIAAKNLGSGTVFPRKILGSCIFRGAIDSPEREKLETLKP